MALAADGRHAASDYLEDAVLAGVRTVGCRRVGGGPAGEPAESNVAEGVALAASLDPDAIVLEGSGSCIPPVSAARTVCVVGGPVEGLDRYRTLRADLLLLMADVEVEGRAFRCELRPEPAEPMAAGARVALFTTGRRALRGGRAGRGVSTNLARRGALAPTSTAPPPSGCDVYLTELKAAAIDTVAARAEAEGARVAFVRNRPVGIDARPRRRADGAATPMPETVVVHRGHGLPYSKGLMSQTLSATGLSPQRAFELAREVERRLGRRCPERRSTWAGLRVLAEEVLAEHEGAGAVRRYRDWHRLDRLDRPLIVMIGGAAGVGKSTLATMLAHRLGITRVIATDVIRQVLRAFFTPRPCRRCIRRRSSWTWTGSASRPSMWTPAVAAIVERACGERTPIVVKGVHAVPGRASPATCAARCVAVEALLVVEDEELHRGHFSLRGAARPGRALPGPIRRDPGPAGPSGGGRPSRVGRDHRQRGRRRLAAQLMLPGARRRRPARPGRRS